MLKVKCPNCGADITFRSGETVYGVCSFCQTAMVRAGISVESIGKVAVLNDTWSALKLGTEGDFDGGHFFVVGRVCYRWERGTWSEWYLSYNDGRTGWMSEAQGFYAMSFAADVHNVPEVTQVSLEMVIDIRGVPYSVTDIKRAEVLFGEGELPFKATTGRTSTTVDLTGPAAAFASIEFSDDPPRVFSGKFEAFDRLKLQNIQIIDGW